MWKAMEVLSGETVFCNWLHFPQECDVWYINAVHGTVVHRSVCVCDRESGSGGDIMLCLSETFLVKWLIKVVMIC